MTGLHPVLMTALSSSNVPRFLTGLPEDCLNEGMKYIDVGLFENHKEQSRKKFNILSAVFKECFMIPRIP